MESHLSGSAKPAGSNDHFTDEKDGHQISTTTAIGDYEVILIPAPSTDPRDPLNWSMPRKARITFALCFAIFTSYSVPFNGQV